MTGMRFAGRLAPNVKNVRPSANSPGDDIVTFTCGHERSISPAVRNRLIDAGGHPVCLQCDGTPWKLDVFYTDERGVPDGGARVQREAGERKAAHPTAPGWDRVDALALVQHVADLERNVSTQTAAIDALTERVEKLEAALARPAEPSCIAYYPKQHTPRWWWQR